MGLKFTNFAEAAIATPPVGTGGLTFSVAPGKGTLFPTLGVGDYFYGIFTNAAKSAFEVVKISARSGDALTIEAAGRGLDNTTAQSWTTSDVFYYGLTSIAMQEVLGHPTLSTDAHTASAITNVPSGNLSATNVQAALDELQADADALDSGKQDYSAFAYTLGGGA